MIHLQAAGTSLVLDARGPQPPVVVHWGTALGDLAEHDLTTLADAARPAVPPSSVDVPLRLSLLPGPAEGWSGRPAFSGAWASAGPARPQWRIAALTRPDELTVEVDQRCADDHLQLTTEIELSAQGVLRVRHRLVNRGRDTLGLDALDLVLPVPRRAEEVGDFSGVWGYERRPQRAPLRDGAWIRETRHGRPGHDDPFLMILGTPGFGFRSGEMWAVHLAWSGDKRLWAERQPLGPSVLGGGERLGSGEVRLAPGDTYISPWAVAVWSGSGLDGLSARLHDWVRSRRASDRPLRRPRPVVLNTWEAVYFNQSLERLRRLVSVAADVGVERFVLDDGWFTGRTDDRRALGDWSVDVQRWPQGLHPLIDAVHEHGMDFGLWVEPEMVSPDSALARVHPEWILGPPTAPTWRHQRVLDLTVPAAYRYIVDSISALLHEYPIAYLKWDHNRDLLQEATAHRQTHAVYRLLGDLRQRFPHLEVESCASGGARVDLGMLDLVDRVWTSDTNDPLERQQIQRWTGILLPPEYLGCHVGAPTAHVTGRTSDLSFRLATALFGSAGIEWDLTTATAAERQAVAEWVRCYKKLRPLLHAATVVRCDGDDAGSADRMVYGVVAPDRATAVFALVTLRAPGTALPAPIRLPGLDPDRHYTVRPLTIGAPPATRQEAPPAWLQVGSVTLPGRVLAEVGLAPPLLLPEQAAIFTADAVEAVRAVGPA